MSFKVVWYNQAVGMWLLPDGYTWTRDIHQAHRFAQEETPHGGFLTFREDAVQMVSPEDTAKLDPSSRVFLWMNNGDDSGFFPKYLTRDIDDTIRLKHAGQYRLSYAKAFRRCGEVVPLAPVSIPVEMPRSDQLAKRQITAEEAICRLEALLQQVSAALDNFRETMAHTARVDDDVERS
jgi:hypothetical protein